MTRSWEEVRAEAVAAGDLDEMTIDSLVRGMREALACEGAERPDLLEETS